METILSFQSLTIKGRRKHGESYKMQVRGKCFIEREEWACLGMVDKKSVERENMHNTRNGIWKVKMLIIDDMGK